MAQRSGVGILIVVACISHVLIESISCLPNIRIQVNNENLKSPPYVLQAIKEAEAAETLDLAASSQTRNNADTQASNPTAIRSDHQVVAESQRIRDDIRKVNGAHHGPETPSSAAEEYNRNHGIVREESIEEILDIDPESVLRLSPEHIIPGMSPSDYLHPGVAASETSNGQYDSSDLAEQTQSNAESGTMLAPSFPMVKNEKIKPQLPVTNSHLKKPAGSLMDDEIEVPVKNEAVAKAESASNLATGAKSLISPTVASDEAPQPAGGPNQMKLHKLMAPPPDTLEPSQVMNGVTNASLVPATITREYGHHSRTRVTLGGGYVRDKSPPLVNPSSDSYEDAKPEKPVTPLEKPQVSGGNMQSNQDSRIIEVPERIVLPASIFKQQPPKQQVAASNNFATNSTRPKLDNRCPRKGVMTIEHPMACDKYYYCEDGILSEETCPNGLLYGTRDMVKDYCVHRWKVVCGEKTIPNPISSPGCRWQNGIFNVQGSPKCSPDFYECIDGAFFVKKCTVEGQVYDDRTKSCQFAESVGCHQEAISDFKCPPDDQGNTYWPFPRYFLNERSLIHCVNDKPEIVRCTDNERVDPEHLHCVPIAKASDDKPSDGSEGLSARRVRERKKVVKETPAPSTSGDQGQAT